jgi:hypothetical protein
MTKRKKQKKNKRWLRRGLILFMLVIFGVLTTQLAIDPIGRYLISKHSPTLAASLPQDELKWNLWSGVYIKQLKLRKVSPVFSEISAENIWIKVSYLSLLFDQISVESIHIEKVSLKSKFSDKNTLKRFSQMGSNLIIKEFHPLLHRSKIKILTLAIDAAQANQLVTLHRISLNVESKNKKLYAQGQIQRAELLGLGAENIDFSINLMPSGALLNIKSARWNGAKIKLKSKIMTKNERVRHNSTVDIESLPLKYGTQLIYNQSLPFNPEVKSSLELSGPLFRWKSWIGQGSISIGGFHLKNLAFQKSRLIKQQMPSLTKFKVNKITIPSFNLRAGKISWDRLKLVTAGFLVEAKGSIQPSGQFKLNGVAKLDQEYFNQLPSLTKTVFDRVGTTYQVPVKVRGDFHQQKITNLNTILRNAVGNQFEAVGSGIRQLFNR